MSMSPQEVYDSVVSHLRTQGRQSFVKGTDICVYRGEGGTKCAVGCLIKDEEYAFWMEGLTIKAVLNREQCPLSLRRRIGGDGVLTLLIVLQGVHDNFCPEEWERELRAVAYHHHLIYTPPGAV